uniref:WH2 domain-containing protein n=1 Tax=Panagrellus redivivus TaxID=6233 RepID=A0A7E5A0N3_PANRE
MFFIGQLPSQHLSESPQFCNQYVFRGSILHSSSSGETFEKPVTMSSKASRATVSGAATGAKSKKKRNSIISFFKWKKKPDPKSRSASDDGASNMESELNFDDLASETSESVGVARSRKSYPAPLPPSENKENIGFDTGHKNRRSIGTIGKNSRQNSIRRSGKRSSTRRRPVGTVKSTTKREVSVASSDSGVPSEPKPLETDFELEPSFPSPVDKSEKASPIQIVVHTKKIEISTKSAKKEVDVKAAKLKNMDSNNGSTSVDTHRSPKMSMPSPPKPSRSYSQSPSAKSLDEHTPAPAIPQSAPPDPVAVNSSLSFVPVKHTTTSTTAVQRLSNFSVSPSKVPPISVTSFEPSHDSPTEKPCNSINTPMYAVTDLKNQLQVEHKKLLNMFEEWEMLRRPGYLNEMNGNSSPDNVVNKQEGLIRQYGTVTSLYNQLMAPVVSTTSSPSSTLRSNKAAPIKHIIKDELTPVNSSRSPLPAAFRSRSVLDLNGPENNNTKIEPQRNANGNHSSHLPSSKQHSTASLSRPRLGDSSHLSLDDERQVEPRRRYCIETKTESPIIRNVPIMTGNVTKTHNNQSPKPQHKDSYTVPIYTTGKAYYNQKPIDARSYRSDSGDSSPSLQQKNYSTSNNYSKPALYSGGVSNNKKPTSANQSPLAGRKISPREPLHSKSTAANQFESNADAVRREIKESKMTPVKQTSQPPPAPPMQQYSQNQWQSREVPKNDNRVSREKQNGHFEVKKTVTSPPKAPSLPVESRNVPSPRLAPKKMLGTPSLDNIHQDILSSVRAFPAVQLRSVPKPVEKSFNVGRVLDDGEIPPSVMRPNAPTNGNISPTLPPPPVMNHQSAGPPAPPPPPPPANFLSSNNKKSPSPKASSPSSPSNDADKLRGDMLAEIRRAGGVGFLRPTNRQ